MFQNILFTRFWQLWLLQSDRTFTYFKDGQTPSREALVELMGRFEQELVETG
ncbi:MULTISPECIES: hypothetical protein [Fischerella]|uniref:hypothetical protein n=1 Tax=Fischerella TaxID=1190 RepID=UPI000A79F25C|nr:MULTISPECIES: hypothetical protein [Fischerella]